MLKSGFKSFFSRLFFTCHVTCYSCLMLQPLYDSTHIVFSTWWYPVLLMNLQCGFTASVVYVVFYSCVVFSMQTERFICVHMLEGKHMNMHWKTSLKVPHIYFPSCVFCIFSTFSSLPFRYICFKAMTQILFVFPTYSSCPTYLFHEHSLKLLSVQQHSHLCRSLFWALTSFPSWQMIFHLCLWCDWHLEFF